MACNRSQPPSPRPPKIQQQSWDDCELKPINLYNPEPLENYHNSASGSYHTSARSLYEPPPIKSPKSPRHFERNKFAGNYGTDQRSPTKSVKSFQQYYPEQHQHQQHQQQPLQRDYKNHYDYDEEMKIITTPPPAPLRNAKIRYSSNGSNEGGDIFYEQQKSPQYYHEQSSPRNVKSPKSPRKFVFDAVSPRYEQKSKKFEYYEPPITPSDDAEEEQIKKFNNNNNTNNSNCCSPQQQTSPNYYYNNNKNNTQQSPNYNNSNSSSSADNKSSSQKHNDNFSYGKRHSGVTESTVSGDSEATSATTTAICESTITTSGGSHNIGEHCNSSSSSSGYGNGTTVSSSGYGGNGNDGGTGGGGGNCADRDIGCSGNGADNSSGGGGGGGGGSAAASFNEDITGIRSRGRRRHAINIISNPGYQVLHTSHSTLDRTCSDSVVSLRCCRKSTSDLTDAVADTNTSAVTTSKHKRRGSSKGNLAYLASRRNSRDSVKSATSNTSIFSNEDIGPLAFQASARGRQRRTSNFLELPVPDHIRPRVCSLPERPYNPRQSDDLYRLRTFSISKGTVVNCGDSIISRRSRSNTSVNSTNSRASERSPFDGSCCGAGYVTVDSIPPSPTDSEPPPPPRYRVVMMGDAGVGKTALVSQFMTSEYMHTYDASLDDEFGEKTVSILLDGEESEMIFIDHPSSEMSVENSLSTYEPHGCVVVYSVVQRTSFRQAEEIVNYLWRENIAREKAVILVGNKADLARSRVIPSSEGKSLAQSRDAKFIETSSGIQHNVDELLVGILKQIRLRETRDKKAAAHTALKMRSSKTHMSLHLAKEILQKICLNDITKSKSCENLHVL